MARTDSKSRGQGGWWGDEEIGGGAVRSLGQILLLTSISLLLTTSAFATEKPVEAPVATPPAPVIQSTPPKENPLNGALRFLGLPTMATPSAAPAEPKRGAVDVALKYLGVRYRFGGRSEKGVDCSGLVRMVFSELGIRVPAASMEQYAAGEEVAREHLLPGDLIFFRDTYRRGISHVAIYVGGSRFIHASRKGVAIASLDSEYFASRYAGARRVPQSPTPAPPTGSAMSKAPVSPIAAGAMLTE